MIDLYYWTTPNGHKITIFLEEAGLEYKIIPVNISKGDQFKPEFLEISPNNRMPAIVDHAPAGGGEAGLGVRVGRDPALPGGEDRTSSFAGDLRGRVEVLQWLFWQMGGLGPMLGQNHHFNLYAPEKIPYAIDRYVNETSRLYQVLDNRLARTANSSPVRTRSPTWRAIRGSCPGSASSRTSSCSRTSSAGSRRFARGPPW